MTNTELGLLAEVERLWERDEVSQFTIKQGEQQREKLQSEVERLQNKLREVAYLAEKRGANNLASLCRNGIYPRRAESEDE